jgi:hypothetical protein
MSPTDTLPPDQQAVLSLLLKQGKSYDDIGALLRMDRETVRWRAHTAVNALGPPDPEGTPEGSHWQTIDYLLGQQSASERAATREALEASPEERAWARAAAAELRPMAAEDLPEIPAEAGEVDRAFEALDGQKAAEDEVQRKSRLGGLLLLGGLGVLVAIVLVLALQGGSSKDKNAAVKTPTATKPATTPPTSPTSTPTSTPATTPPSTPSTTPPSTPTTTPPKTTTTPPTGSPKTIATINLAVPGGAAKTPIGAAAVFELSGALNVNIVATGLQPGGNSFAYGIWLAGGTGGSKFIGFTPNVKANTTMRVLAMLPANVNAFKTLELTKETTSTPTTPGTVVLQGALPPLKTP